MTTLVDWEETLKTQLAAIDLIGELDLSTEQTADIALLIRTAAYTRGSSGVVDWLLYHHPRTLVVFLVFQGIYGYESGDFWSAICDAIGAPNTGNYTQELGRAFENAIRRLGLSHPSAGHRFVGAILGHGGIPRKSLPDFFEHMMQPSVTRSDLTGLTAAELIQEWLDRSSRYHVDKPVLRFLQYGGPVAEDFVNRCRHMLQDYGETGEIPPAEQLGLPASVVEAYQKWANDPGRTAVIRPSGPRLRSPQIVLDPWGSGVSVLLPEQQIPIAQSLIRVRWIVASDKDSSEIVTRVRRVDFDLKSEMIRYPLAGPARRFAIRLYFGSDLQREWIFEGVEDDCSIIAFDPETGTILPSTKRLPARPLWILSSSNARLKIDEKPADPRFLEVFPILPWQWRRWKGREIDLNEASNLTVESGSASRSYLVIQGQVLRRPELVEGNRVSLIDNAVPLFAQELPLLRVWTQTDGSAEDTLPRWRLELRNEWDADPVIDRRDRLIELSSYLRRDSGVVDLPMMALLGDKPIGQYRLRVLGPLGSDSELRFRAVPWLVITGHENPFIPDRLKGAPVVSLLVESDRQTTVEVLESEVGLKVEEATCTDDTRCYEVTVPPNMTAVPLRIIRELPSGKKAYVPLRIPLRRLRWLLVLSPQSMLQPVWQSIAASVPQVEFEQSESPFLLVELPIDELDRDVTARLRFLDSEGVSLVEFTGQRGARPSRFVRFDLQPIRDTLRQSDAPTIRAELTIQGISSMPEICLPALTLGRQITLGALTAQLDADAVPSTLSIAWAPEVRLRWRHVRFWPISRPWRDPEGFDIPDASQNQYIAVPPPDSVVPGEYLIEFTVRDPWLQAATPERPAANAPNATRCTLGDLGRRLVQLNEEATDDPPRVFAVACERVFLARALNDESQLQTSLEWCYDHIEEASAAQLVVLAREFSEQPIAKALRMRMFRPQRIRKMLGMYQQGTLSDRGWQTYLDQLPPLSRLSPEACEELLQVPDERVQLAVARLLIEQGKATGLAAAYAWHEQGKLSKQALENLLALNPHFSAISTPSYLAQRASELSLQECIEVAQHSDLEEYRMAALSSLMLRGEPEGVTTTLFLVDQGAIPRPKALQLLESNLGLSIRVLLDAPPYRSAADMATWLVSRHPDQVPTIRDGTWVRCRLGWGKIRQISSRTRFRPVMGIEEEDLESGCRLSVTLLLEDGTADVVIDTRRGEIRFDGPPRLYICTRCESYVAWNYETIIYRHFQVQHGSSRERKFRFLGSPWVLSQTEPLEFSQSRPSSVSQLKE